VAISHRRTAAGKRISGRRPPQNADVDWMKKIIEGKFSTDFISKVKSVLDKISDNTDKKAILKILVEIFGSSVKKAG
jgi:hypothetical protein